MNTPTIGKGRSMLFMSRAVISVGDVSEPTELLASKFCVCIFYVHARRFVVLD
jgi:hypothetical protein